MGIKETLKENQALRGAVKRIKNYREFLGDAKDFSEYYEEEAEKNGDFSYRLLLYIHNLEKGMCRENPRPFGKDKVKTIISILQQSSELDLEKFEYKLATAVLRSWLQFYDDKGWKVGEEERAYIVSLKEPDLRAGAELLNINGIRTNTFDDVIFTRRSVRDFTDEPLRQNDIDYAVNCFIAAPTACNRQMCRIYRICNNKHKDLLENTILGIGGFNLETTNLFIITYDVAAFEFYGERNQGYLNVGLTAMSFVYGLHARGIGSCFMQWSNKKSDDTKIRNELNIPKSERIGVILGAGYYKNKTMIPCSTRRNRDSVYSEL